MTDQTYERQIPEAAMQEIEWGRQRPALFLAAWKRGVKLAGEIFFDVQSNNVDAATDKNQLQPNYKIINQRIGAKSSGERAFLAAMYIFYNASDGQKLAESIDCPTLYDISMYLDKQRLEIIAELFINNCGW